MIVFERYNFYSGCDYALIRTHMCAYQGVRNINFSENYAYIINGGFRSSVIHSHSFGDES